MKIFFEDMGLKPSLKHSLDRIDTEGKYEKENCLWATSFQQGQNTRKNVNLTLNGKTHCITEWARQLNIPMNTIYTRFKAGWSVEKILSNKRFSRYTK